MFIYVYLSVQASRQIVSEKWNLKTDFQGLRGTAPEFQQCPAETSARRGDAEAFFLSQESAGKPGVGGEEESPEASRRRDAASSGNFSRSECCLMFACQTKVELKRVKTREQRTRHAITKNKTSYRTLFDDVDLNTKQFLFNLVAIL